MCGIVGFTGLKQAAPVLLSGLSKLEYRGYDSAGIAVRDGEKEPEVVKAKGKLKVLIEKTNGGEAVKGSCGIGHTRWATHGEPSELNAHPHSSDDENVIAVHNGIIENYQELKEKLTKSGYTFCSQTDTEVAVKLIDYYFKTVILPMNYTVEAYNIICNYDEVLARQNKIKVKVQSRFMRSLKFIDVYDQAYDVGMSFETE